MSSKAAISSFPDMNTDFTSIFNSMKIEVDQAALDHDNYVQTMPVDPLALVLQWRADPSYKHNPKLSNKGIYEALDFKAGISVKNYPEVDQSFIDQAEVINRHFRNKLLMTGLKGYELSTFRVALMTHLENPLNLVNKHIKILLRLPDFYQEDIDIHDLERKYDGVEPGVSCLLESVIEYVATVDRVVSKHPHKRHYFKTSNNKLLCFNVEDANSLQPMMNYIINSKQPVTFRGSVYGGHITGYPNFSYYMIGGNNYELY